MDGERGEELQHARRESAVVRAELEQLHLRGASLAGPRRDQLRDCVGMQVALRLRLEDDLAADGLVEVLVDLGLGQRHGQNLAEGRRLSGLESGAPALLAQLVEHLHGKEGVDGSSPSEGSAKAPHVGAFSFRPTCSLSNVRCVWSRLWSFRVQNGVARGRANGRVRTTGPTRQRQICSQRDLEAQLFLIVWATTKNRSCRRLRTSSTMGLLPGLTEGTGRLRPDVLRGLIDGIEEHGQDPRWHRSRSLGPVLLGSSMWIDDDELIDKLGSLTACIVVTKQERFANVVECEHERRCRCRRDRERSTGSRATSHSRSTSGTRCSCRRRPRWWAATAASGHHACRSSTSARASIPRCSRSPRLWGEYLGEHPEPALDRVQ